MAIDPKDQAQLNALLEEYIALQQQVNNKDRVAAELMANKYIASGQLLDNVERLRKELNDTLFASDYLLNSFRETLAELKNQNVALQVGRGIFKDLTNIAQDLTYFQKGLTDLEDKHFRKKQQTLKISQDNLKDLVRNLGVTNSQGELEYRREKTLNALQNLKLQKGFKLNESQKRLLDQLQKENDLLFASQDTLKEGLPILQRELDISKQIYEVREDLGGLAGAAAATISQYGGDLARFLKVDDALESVRNYNQDIIRNALTNKENYEQIKKFDKERDDAYKKLIVDQNILNSLEADQIKLEEIKNELADKSKLTQAREQELQQEESQILAKHISAQNLQTKINTQSLQKKQTEIALAKDLKEIDEKEAAYKMEVINRTNKGLEGFKNKLVSLGVLIQGLGAGLKKILTDPVTIITFFIGRALEANKQSTEMANSLRLSGDAASRLRDNFVAYSNSVNDNFVNQTRLTKAQNELSKAIGLSVAFREKDLETFARLTELMGLSSEEGAKIYKLATLTGKDYGKYTNDVAKAAYYASVNTKQNITTKEALQTISKLSAGILIKFQGNTQALVQNIAEAKKLGLTLEQIDKVGESLLNWEQSIENELKAELLTGRQINLERARYAALTGNQLELTREIASQVGTLAEYENMNVLAQRSLAEAFGLSRDEMSEMLLQQELINREGDKAVDLTNEQRKAFIAAQKAKPNLTLGEFLTQQEQQLTIQQKFNNAIIKLQEIIGGLVDGPLSRLIDSLANGLDLVSRIFGVFGQIGDAIKGLFGAKVGGLLGDAASVATIGTLIALVASSLTKGTFINPMVTIPFGGVAGIFGKGGKPPVPPVLKPPVATPKLIPSSTSGIIPGKGPLAPIKSVLPKYNATTGQFRGVGGRFVTAPKIIPPTPPANVGFLTRIGNIFTRFGGTLSNIFRGVLSGFGNIFRGVLTGFRAVGGAIGSLGKILGLGGVLSGVFGFADAFSKKKAENKSTGEAVGAGALQGTLAAAGAAIGTAFGGPIGTMIGGFLGNSLGKWINENAPGVAASFGKVWDSMIKKLSGVTEFFSTLGKGIDSLLQKLGFGEGLGALLSDLATMLGTAIVVPFTAVMSALGLVGDILGSLAKLMQGDFRGAWNQLTGGFKDFLDNIIQPIADAFAIIKGRGDEKTKQENAAESVRNISEGQKLVGSEKFEALVKIKMDETSGFTKFLRRMKYMALNPVTGDKATTDAALDVYNRQVAEEETLRGIKGLATGGEVLKTGIAKVDAGEVYLGKSTRETFRILAANSVAQTQYLLTLISSLTNLNTLSVTPVVDAINNLASKLTTTTAKPTPTPVTTTATTNINFDLKSFSDIVNKLLTTPLNVNAVAIADAIKGINITPTVTNQVNFTPLLDAIKGINASSITNVNVDLNPLLDAIKGINIPQVNFSPLIDAIKEINVTPTITNQINLNPIVDAIKGISVSSINNISVNLNPLLDAIKGISVSPITNVNINLNPLIEAIRGINIPQVDFTPLLDAIKGINITVNPTISNQVDFTPLLDAINKINIAPVINNAIPVIAIDLAPLIEAINKISIAPPQVNNNISITQPEELVTEQPKPTVIPQPIPQQSLSLFSDTLKSIYSTAGTKTEAPATQNNVDIKPMVNAINEVKSTISSLKSRPIILYIDGKAIAINASQNLNGFA